MPAAAPNLSEPDYFEASDRDLALLADHGRTPEIVAAAKAEQLSRKCPKGYGANPARVVRGPVVQLQWPVGASGGEFLGTDEARAFANAILAAADVADRNG